MRVAFESQIPGFLDLNASTVGDRVLTVHKLIRSCLTCNFLRIRINFILDTTGLDGWFDGTRPVQLSFREVVGQRPESERGDARKRGECTKESSAVATSRPLLVNCYFGAVCFEKEAP